MILTISQVITELVTEVGQDTSDTDFAAIMLVFLKSGMRELPVSARDRLLLTQEELALAINTQEIDLSTTTSGFMKENHVWYTTSTGNRIPIIPPPRRSYFNEIFNTNSRGKPKYYVVVGKTMQFEQKADEAVTIGIEFFKEISAISTSDTFFGDERTLQACKHLCKKGYYQDYEEDRTKYIDHRDDAARIIFELEADYEDQEFAGHVGE